MSAVVPDPGGLRDAVVLASILAYLAGAFLSGLEVRVVRHPAAAATAPEADEPIDER